jgi:hypothetical protein
MVNRIDHSKDRPQEAGPPETPHVHVSEDLIEHLEKVFTTPKETQIIPRSMDGVLALSHAVSFNSGCDAVIAYLKALRENH